MTGGSPTSTHPHTIHHLPLRTSPPSSSANNGLTQSLNLSHSSSASTPVSTLTRGGSGERSSFGKGKNRSKSPALLRFFVRGTGGSRKTSEVEEEDYGSSGSDHEDPFSVSFLSNFSLKVRVNKFVNSWVNLGSVCYCANVINTVCTGEVGTADN